MRCINRTFRTQSYFYCFVMVIKKVHFSTSCFYAHYREKKEVEHLQERLCEALARCTSAEVLSLQQQEELQGLKKACSSAEDSLETSKKELAADKEALAAAEAQLASEQAGLKTAEARIEALHQEVTQEKEANEALQKELEAVSSSKVGGHVACLCNVLLVVAFLYDESHRVQAMRIFLPAHRW